MGEEQADQHQHQPGGLPEGAGGVRKMVLRRTSPRRSGGSMSTATSLGITLKKNINKHASIYNAFILLMFSGNKVNTLCIWMKNIIHLATCCVY